MIKDLGTLEGALESYIYGYGTTYDGDNHTVLYNTECNHCGKYFESNKIHFYCDECIKP